MSKLAFTFITIAIFLSGKLSAEPADDAVDFELRIRPILIEHCAKCHGSAVQKNGLRLDAKHAAFKASDNGPVIVPGTADQSELFRRIISTDPDVRMPPEGQPLEARDIELLKRWIDLGANWPETDYDRVAAHDPRLDHWSWQPVQSVSPPALAESLETSAANNVDRFILSRLNEKSLTLSTAADRRTLIRRLSYDLHGLPPSPSDVAAFLSDSDPDAVT
ncbi:MAG: DUF1549 domain-containing protein, partial [Planctomycetota bacterium]|nr:DUF1549 domain-containing protein [Planctomycetota bacterium]